MEMSESMGPPNIGALARDVIAILGSCPEPARAWNYYADADGIVRIGVSDRHVITLTPDGDAVRLTMRGTAVLRDTQFTVRLTTADPHALEGVFAMARWWAERLSVYRLERGKRYRIAHAFCDFNGAQQSAGDTLVFVSRGFVPYDGLNYLSFEERLIVLHDDDQGAILDDFDAYFEPA